MKYVSIFPEYPMSIFQMEELRRYRKKVVHSQLDAASLIRLLNGPSRILRTLDGHHLNKSFIVGVRDYADPLARKSDSANYERRTQMSLYVSLELATLEEISGVINVRRIADNVELCLERALAPTDEGMFIGILTDWNTTEKLDALIDPGIMDVLDMARLSHSYLAVNRNLIKSFIMIREMDEAAMERTLKPRNERTG